jgi:hypothetical protein
VKQVVIRVNLEDYAPRERQPSGVAEGESEWVERNRAFLLAQVMEPLELLSLAMAYKEEDEDGRDA